MLTTSAEVLIATSSNDLLRATPTTSGDNLEVTSPGTMASQNTVVRAVVGAAFGGLAFIMVVMLFLMVVIFVILRKQRNKQMHLEATNKLYEEIPDIALSPTIHIEVNERGRIRRRTMDTQSQHEISRTRAVSNIIFISID